MKSRPSFMILTTGAICLMATAGVQRVSGQTQQNPQVPAGAIPATECRIKLMDRAELASDISGIIEFVEPEEGDIVSKGTTVAGLRADVAKAAYEVAKITASNDVEVRYAQASKELAQKELEKAISANAEFTGAVPEIEVHRLRLAVKKAELEIENAQHKFNINLQKEAEAGAQLQSYSVNVPISGIVTDVKKKRGEAVRQGDVILEVVSTDRLKVEGFINKKDAFRVRRGMPVAVRLKDDAVANPEQAEEVFQGRVMLVDPQVDAVNQNLVKIVAMVENRQTPEGADMLRAGLTVDMVVVPE